ncbi:MAG: CRISPR system precrRNA processing endoribonuclease RAMP protein Cas6 [Geobacter sp.]|nr:CRISPR system precrRNA processing endoribonuclease RAMP protein Cas6 [Geobacter sp.]
MDLNLTRLRFTVRQEVDPPGPYALFSVRNEFATHYQRTVCVADGLCHSCLDRENCPYPANFAQDLAVDPYALKRHQKPSLPFVFDLPLLPPAAKKGETFEIFLNLFGTAINHVSHYVEAVRRMFSEPVSRDALRGTIVGVESIDWRGNAQPLSLDDPASAMVIFAAEDVTFSFALPDRLILQTPLQLIRDGKVSRTLDPAHFLMSIVRRVSSMVYYYGGYEMEVDYPLLAQASSEAGMADAAIGWEEWGGGKCAGLVGEATLTGVAEDFRPFLALGGLMHLGKGAAYGMGRFDFA